MPNTFKGRSLIVWSEFIPDENSYRAEVMDDAGTTLHQSETFANEDDAIQDITEWCEGEGIKIKEVLRESKK